MEVVAEERRLYSLAKLPCRLVATERERTDAVTFRRPPLPVKPRAGHHEVRVVRVMLVSMAKDLPRSPGIFLIPEARNVQEGDRRRVELADPGFFLPELVVVRVGHNIVPVGN